MEKGIVLFAIRGGEIVGCVNFFHVSDHAGSIEPGEASIYALAVLPEWQKKYGIGSALLDEGVNTFIAEHPNVDTAGLVPSPEAIDFYKKSYFPKRGEAGNTGFSWWLSVEEGEDIDPTLAATGEHGRPTFTITIHKKEAAKKNPQAFADGLYNVNDMTANGKQVERSQEADKVISGTSTANRQLFTRLERYMTQLAIPAEAKGKLPQVNIDVDLSLIPAEDMRENIETWAYLVLSCLNIENVNFNFALPDPVESGEVPEALREQIKRAAAQSEAIKMLKEEIRVKAVAFQVPGNIDELLEKRINAPAKEGAIEVPIISKAWLEWMKERGIALKVDQYPVAMDGVMSSKDSGEILRNFEAALTIALADAALVLAKKRDENKKEGEKEEFPEIRKNILDKLQKVYGVMRGDVTLTETTIDNIVNGSSTTRMNLAISLALPPIVKMYVQELKDLHERIQLALQAA